MAGAGFRDLLLICLLNLTLNEKSSSHSLQFAFEVSCLFRFTPAANSGSHTSQFGSGGLILYWSRIRKFVTHRQTTENRRTDREQRTEKAITEPL